MKLLLERQTLTANSTEGMLSVDGVFECYTLEKPKDDPLEIPAASYPVVLYSSPKFGRVMPMLVGVPGRANIEIHYGNTEANTEGCILVGQTKSVDFIGNSRAAFEHLFPQIQKAILGNDPVELTITDAL